MKAITAYSAGDFRVQYKCHLPVVCVNTDAVIDTRHTKFYLLRVGSHRVHRLRTYHLPFVCVTTDLK